MRNGAGVEEQGFGKYGQGWQGREGQMDGGGEEGGGNKICHGVKMGSEEPG